MQRVRRWTTAQGWPRLLLTTLIPTLLLLLTGVIAGLPPSDGELVRGVTVAGISTTDRDWAAVEADLDQRAAAWLALPITVQLGDRTATFLPEELGVTYDAAATYTRALEIGRGPLFDSAVERFTAHTRGVDIAPVIAIDQERLLASLHSVADEMLIPARNATFVWNGTALQVNPSADGTGINAQRVANALTTAAAAFTTPDLVLTPNAVAPPAGTDDLVGAHPEAQKLFNQPVVIGSGEQWWQITPQALAKLLTWNDGLAVDRTALSLLVSTLAPDLNRNPEEPRVVLGDDAVFVVEPLSIGSALNVQASVDRIMQGLLAGNTQIALQLDERQTRYSDAELQALADEGNAMVARGMTVHWADGQQTLDPWPFASAMKFDPATGEVSFDSDALFGVLEPIAHAINRPASGFRWQDFQIVAPDGAQLGRTVDISASVNQVINAALSGQASVDLAVNDQEDPANNADLIVISDMLGSASTYYGSSSYNRTINVELAADQLDGALIPPGGEFSFNTAIGGTASLDDGYQMGYGIVGGANGDVQTVPSVAGGICQVSTTAFQAAFWSGMPIGERNWHLYWIPNYGSGPGGLMGLDATVDPDYGLDFTFVNPTDDWVAINAYHDGEWVTVEVWGTNQGWQVQVDGPELSNVVKADPTPVRRFDASVPPGGTVAVEHAQDGFTADIHRKVTSSDGTVVDERTFTSYYQPARNVTLVGEGVSLTPDLLDVPPATTVEEPETPATTDTEEPIDSADDTTTTEEPTTPVEEPVDTPAEGELPVDPTVTTLPPGSTP